MKAISIAMGLVLASLSFTSVAASYDIKDDVVDPLDVIGDRCAPGDVLYYGQNMKHSKEVLVCQWGNKVFYSFGVVGKKPEMDLKASNKKFKAEVSDGNTWSLEQMVIPNGDVTYVVGHVTDFIKGSEEETLRVYKTKNMGEPIAVITLDPMTVVNGIRNNFVE